MIRALQKLPLRFYRLPSGVEPVRRWLLELPQEERRAIGLDLMRLQFRWPVGMPLCRPLGGGLSEVRTTLPGNRISRVLFCVRTDCLIALHGFIKKSRAAPADIAVARRRMKELPDVQSR